MPLGDRGDETASASSSGSADKLTLKAWLQRGPYTLALSSGFLGCFAHCGALQARSCVAETHFRLQSLAAHCPLPRFAGSRGRGLFTGTSDRYFVWRPRRNSMGCGAGRANGAEIGAWVSDAFGRCRVHATPECSLCCFYLPSHAASDVACTHNVLNPAAAPRAEARRRRGPSAVVEKPAPSALSQCVFGSIS